MSLINFGSYCIDNVYSVPHFVRPGETLPSVDYQIHPGGKGLNQSLALAYAGAQVKHAGKIGQDGIWLRDLLTEAGVDTSLTQIIEGASGHANIQVTPQGENAIVIYGGANNTITRQDIADALVGVSPGDYVLIQNETSCLVDVIEMAAEKQQRVIFNAAPMTDEVNKYPLDIVEFFVINELEGQALSNKPSGNELAGSEKSTQEILDSLLQQFPESKVILTLGEDGAIYKDATKQISQAAFPVTATDTTGAGDTFTGYFFAGLISGLCVEECLENACKSAAICVTRKGAASSIPRLQELADFRP